MTQVFTGSGLGLQGSSFNQLGNYGPKGIAGLGQGGSSVYVNAANGNLVLKQQDGFLADRGLNLNIFQTYNSQGEKQGEWRFNTQSKLEFKGIPHCKDSSIVRIDEDGHRSLFTFDINKNVYISKDNPEATLKNQNGCWEFHNGNNKVYSLYDAKGVLAQLKDNNGHVFIFYYKDGQLESISNNTGKQSLHWSFKEDRLEDFTVMSDGKTVHHMHYSYDIQGRLQTISRDLGTGKTYSITYGYAKDSNQVSSIRQSDGTALFIEYDQDGRIKSLIDGNHQKTTYSYGLNNTTITTPKGEKWIYFYNNEGELLGIDGPENYKIRYTYKNHQLESMVQGEMQWRFYYNEAGDCVKIEEPSGRITTRTFDAEHHLLKETQFQSLIGNTDAPNTQSKQYIYDAKGNIRFAIDSQGAVTEYRYNLEGELSTTRLYLKNAFYSGNNLDIIALQTMETWIKTQDQQTVQLTEFRYDWRGQCEKEIHYLQVDNQGNGITKEARFTQFEYDAAGRLLSKSIPTEQGLSTTIYLYDGLGRLISTQDNQGHITHIEYDDTHSRIITTNPQGLQTMRLYDANGQCLSIQYLNTKQDFGTITYTYDIDGNKICETHTDGTKHWYFYDHQGRLHAKVGSTGQFIQYQYDEYGHCIQVHEYKNYLDVQNWDTIPPAFENLYLISNLADRISQSIYNKQGLLAYSINAQGAMIGYRYDIHNQLIEKIAYALPLPSYQSNIVLKEQDIHPKLDTEDRHIFYYYNKANHLEAVVDAEGSATEYDYDLAGNLLKSIQYANKTINHSGHWSKDKPLENIRNDIHKRILYDNTGLKIAEMDSNGYLKEYRYNTEGLLIETIAYAKPANLGDSLEMIRPLSDNNDHKSTYLYNDLGQLIQSKDSYGLITTYTYDALGKVLTVKKQDAKNLNTRIIEHRYDVLGRVIASLDAIGSALLQNDSLDDKQQAAIWKNHSIQYTYDKAGRLITQTNALQETTRYYYDKSGALIYTINAQGAVSETHYNAFNQIEVVKRYSTFLSTHKEYTTEELSKELAKLSSPQDSITENQYNRLGQLISQKMGTQNEQINTYNIFGELSETIGSNKAVNIYGYNKQGLLEQTIQDALGVQRFIELKYDAFGRIIHKIDGENQNEYFTYDRCGQLILISRDLPGYKRYKWDAFGRKLSETNWNGSLGTVYEYDDQNNTFSIKDNAGNCISITKSNSFGDTIYIKDTKGQEWHYAFNENGQCTSIRHAENIDKIFIFDTVGHLVEIKDALGQVTKYTYDAQNQILTETRDANHLALKTSYQYDAIGRRIQIKDPENNITEFDYNSAGLLVSICKDPHNLNLLTTFKYDDAGRLILQTTHNPQGKNQSTGYLWDNLDRRIATIIDPQGLALKTEHAYDKSDNLIKIIDANGNQTHYVYNQNNQCIYIINAKNFLTEQRYDLNGNLINTIRFAHPLIKNYTFENIKKDLQESAQDQWQWNDYDNLNRLSLSFNALGYGTRYEYDNRGNVSKITRFAQARDLNELKSGDLHIPKEWKARKTYFAYDALNQLRFTTNNDGYVKEHLYDAVGNCIKTIEFANRIPSVEQAKDVNVMSSLMDRVKSPQDHLQKWSYDSAGRLAFQVQGGGRVIGYIYNGVDKIITTTHYAMRISPMNDDWEKTIQFSLDDRKTHTIYDAAGREVFQISAEGRVTEKQYDNASNVIVQIQHAQYIKQARYTLESLKSFLKSSSANRIIGYTYDAAGRLIENKDPNQQSTKYSYDKNNNMVAKNITNKAIWYYKYDENNQLIESKSPEISIMVAKGERYETVQTSIITCNIYDGFGNLITIIQDPQGLAKTQRFIYDNNNQRIETIYPDVSINIAGQSISNQRQEQFKTLSEKCSYNAFGEVITKTDKNQNISHYIYDNQGKLCFILDNSKTIIGYRYDAFGNVLTMTSFAEKLTSVKNYDLDTIIHESNHIASKYDRHQFYKYDSENQLVQLTKNNVNMFDSSRGIYKFAEAPVTEWRYNAFGQVIAQQEKTNTNDWAITRSYYDKDGNIIGMLDPLNYLTTKSYTVFGELELETQFAQKTQATDSSFLIPTDQNARKILYKYDILGRVVSKTQLEVTWQELQPNGNIYKNVTGDLTNKYTYDALGNLTSMTDAYGNISFNYYDVTGQLTAKVGPTTSKGKAAITYAYDALGQLVQTHKWSQGVAFASENTFNLNSAHKEDQITEDFFDNYGHLLSHKDATQQITNYSYDANGNVARSWRALKQIDGSTVIQDKRYTYDPENRLLQTLTFKTNNQITTEDMLYNAFGEMTHQGINGEYLKKIDYDQLGRVWRSNVSGHVEIYLYDLADHVTEVVTAANLFRPEFDENCIDLSTDYFENALNFEKGHSNYDLQRLDNIYDACGRLLEQKKFFAMYSDTQSNILYFKEAILSNTYDRWGNTIKHINANGSITEYTFNAFDKIIKQELPSVWIENSQGQKLHVQPVNYYAYDALGRLIAVTDANGHTQGKRYDAQGNLTEEIDAKGNKRTKIYNNLNQLIQSTNELGANIYYTYDEENRLKSCVTSGTRQFYQYNADGKIIQQSNALGETIQYWYDSSGNMEKRKDVQGNFTYYQYDDFGHKIYELDTLGNSQSWTYEGDLLKTHKDLGGNITTYTHNRNGLVLTESSTRGKHMTYHYTGDGQIKQFVDDTRSEVINFTYDKEGKVVSKEAGRAGNYQDGWIRETDHYTYDELGRLTSVRRRRPEDIHQGVPKDNALLSVDYTYDAVGNIRHTHVEANYTGYQRVETDDYYTYDANDRMHINKGSLINGNILIATDKGSVNEYDAAGNISVSSRYENGNMQNYSYKYTKDNQLELVSKNNQRLQSKSYDAAGRVEIEKLFDVNDNISQENTMIYKKGIGTLEAQITKNRIGKEISKTLFEQDAMGNVKSMETRVHQQLGKAGYTLSHHYRYEGLFDEYQQSHDSATFQVDGQSATYGLSTRNYDVNGHLQDVYDQNTDSSGRNHTTHYWASGIDGIRAKQDDTGQTSYLNIAGNNIGDLRLDNNGKQKLNIHGGFNPTGKAALATPSSRFFGFSDSNFTKKPPMEFRSKEIVITLETPAPDAPQNNLGAYTVQYGDTLETIALQIYGDSNLWYLLADANGITDRFAKAGVTGSLQVGQRINIPAGLSQKNSNETKNVSQCNQIIGNTSATFANKLVKAEPIKRKKTSLLSKVAMAVVTMVATVLTAGIAGIAMGASIATLNALFSTGLQILSGMSALGIGGTIGAGFAAGFLGNMAGQGIANVLGMQKGFNLKEALLNAVSTGASTGLMKGWNTSSLAKSLQSPFTNTSTELFNLTSASQMMAQDIINQSTQAFLNQDAKFNLTQLATAGITGGIAGSTKLQNSRGYLQEKLGNTAENIITSELQALTGHSLESTLSQNSIHGKQILTDNLGNALANAILTNPINTKETEDSNFLSETLQELLNPDQITEKIFKINQERKQISLDFNPYEASGKNDYHPVQKDFHEDKREFELEKEPESTWQEKIKYPIKLNFLFNSQNPDLIDVDFISSLSTDLGRAKLIYETTKKIEINRQLKKAGNLHDNKIRRLSRQSDLKGVRDVFITTDSKSHIIANNAVTSRFYKGLDFFGKVLGVGYVIGSGYNAYTKNINSAPNIRRTEAVAAGIGATGEIIVGGAVSNICGIIGASLLGSGSLGALAPLGYSSGFIICSGAYSYTGGAEFINRKFTNFAKFFGETDETRYYRKFRYAHIR